MGSLITLAGVVSLIALEVAILLVCFHRRAVELLQAHGLWRFGLLIGAQLIAVCLFLFGAYVELRWDLSDSVEALGSYEIPELESLELRGDASLQQWAVHEEPRARPDFSTLESFQAWQNELRAHLLEVFELPEIAAPVDVSWRTIATGRLEGGIRRALITFDSFDGTEIPAYLFVPQSENPSPAVLVFHGHVDNPDVGISQTAGLVSSYQNNAALELAQAGFVTLTFEFRGFGYLGPRMQTDHRFVAYNALVGGSFYKAVVARDAKYAFDLLREMPEVLSDAVGVTGASFGGEMAATYAALDQRVAATVFQSYGGELGPFPGLKGTDPDEQPHGCHLIPGHNGHLLQEDLFLLTAPRPLLGVEGDQDYSGDREAFTQVVTRAYEIHEAPANFDFQVVPGGHEFYNQPAIDFLKAHLSR